MHPRMIVDEDDDEQPISHAQAPVLSAPITLVDDKDDDDDMPFSVPAPVITAPARAPAVIADDDEDEEDDDGPPLAVPCQPEPLIPYPPAPPRTEIYSSVVYEQDEAHTALPRESPKRLCSSGDLPELARETTTASQRPDRRPEPMNMRVEIGQWREEATGKVVEPRPMPRVIQRSTVASESTWNSADQLIMCQSPLTPGPHSPACPCIECIERRAYERGKAEGTVRTQFVHICTAAGATADGNPHDPHGPPMPDGTYHGEPSFFGGVDDAYAMQRHDNHLERALVPAHIPAAVFQIPVPAPSPPAQAPVARRRKQSQKKPASSNTTNDDRDGKDEQQQEQQQRASAQPAKPARKPRPRSTKDPAMRDRRDERDDMAASREAYEASVPTTVREATAYAQEDAVTDQWLARINVRPPKEDREDKKMRLAFRAQMRAPYDMDRIRAEIDTLFNSTPANEPALPRSRDARPVFLVNVMCHDMVPATGSSEACGMRGFDKSMKTRPCVERMTKPAEGKRKICNAHSLTLKAIRTLVMATVGTARMLGLPRNDDIVSVVFDALAEIVQWFAATSIYSSRAYSTLELYTCTRYLVSTLVEANRDKALSILNTRAT